MMTTCHVSGEVPTQQKPTAPLPHDAQPPPPAQLPGKKAYVPPYTPKSAATGGRSSSGGGGGGGGNRSGSRGSNSSSRAGSSAKRSSTGQQFSTDMGGYAGVTITPSGSSGRGSPGFSKAKKPKLTDEERLEVDCKYSDKPIIELISKNCCVFLLVAVLPQRERSTRKAKMNARKQEQNIQLEGDEDERDVNFSDSDDDATWTPFKGDRKGSKGLKGILGNDVDLDDDDEDEEDDDDEGDDDFAVQRRKEQLLAQHGQQLPGPSRFVPEGTEFRVGDFMVLKSDAHNDNVPIWK